MLGYYSYLLSFVLMIHWTINCASLPSSEEIDRSSTSRNAQHFNSQMLLIKRLKRWTKMEENDEIEIPLNETNLSVNSTDETLLNSTSFDSETIESNSSIIETFENSTSYIPLNMTTIEVFDANETTTLPYPLLRQDLINDDLNDTFTTETVFQEVNFSSTVSSEWTSTNCTGWESSSTSMTELDQVTINDRNESIDRSFLVPTLHNLTSNESESTLNSNFSDSMTIFETISEENSTNDWESSYNESSIETLIHSNLTHKNTILIDQDTQLNGTDSMSSSSLESITIPLCDRSCQCRQECSYGFELVNDTCLCTPPCQNYRCFGNDTCTVTDEGQRSCRPENGTEHDRPTRCYQPRDSGSHDLTMRYHNRWYYNPDQDTCHLFVYRGSGGNENNFRTLHECHLECITCAPAADPGECLGRIEMWAYNNKKDECIQFDYSGCKGNENKFLKKEICVDTCIRRILNVK